MSGSNVAPGVENVVEALRDPVRAAQIGYAQHAWADQTVSGAPFSQVVAALSDGREVTALVFQDNPMEETSSLDAIVGIIRTQGANRVLDVGVGGYVITEETFRDIVVGSNGRGVFAAHYEKLVSVLPELEPLTADHLLDLPGENVDASEEEQIGQRIALTIFGNRRMPGPTAYGSLFFVTEHNEGVLDGFLYVAPGTYWESEHGSTYVKDALGQHGLVRVKNQDPNLLFARVMGVLGHGEGFYQQEPAEVYAAIQAH